jgi:integrin beta 8
MKNPFRSLRSWNLHVRIESHRPSANRNVVVIGPDDLESSLDDRSSASNNSIKPDLGARGQMLDDWLNELNNQNSNQLDDDHVLTVSVVCHGRDCRSLRHWRLSAQLRLMEVSSGGQEADSSSGGGGGGGGGRVKRHIGKKNAVKSNKNNNNSNNNSSNKKRTAPQPKDILLGQYSGPAKKGKSGGSDCSSNTKKSKKCCPHSLKINFRQLPGFDWILEPSEIDIFMCKGDCHYAQFTSQHQHAVTNPASNHALFQGYLHTINKRLVPKLCCTPSKLDSVQVVHYDQENPAQLTTTKWEGAIVKECACA